LTRPRTARELYFATALPMAYAQIALPTSFTLPTYSQPYTTVRAVAIGAEEIYISMDSNTCPVTQAFAIYGGRTFSSDVAGATPRLRHLLSTVTARAYIDVRDAFLSHFGQPAVGERLAFRVVHWQPGATSKTTWPLTCNVLHRSLVINPNPRFELAWVANLPSNWTEPSTYVDTRITVNPLEQLNSWQLVVGDNVNTSQAHGPWGAPLAAGHTYEIRYLLSVASGTLTIIAIYDTTPTYDTLLTAFAGPWQGEKIHTLAPTAINGNCTWWIANNPHVPVNFTIDLLSIREIL
jgi:hypothetical protein